MSTIKDTITFDPKSIKSIKEAEANATATGVINSCNEAAKLLMSIDDVAGKDKFDKQPGFVESVGAVPVAKSSNSVYGSLLYDTTSKQPIELNATLFIPGIISGRAPLTIKQSEGQKTYHYAQWEVVENKNGSLTVNTYDEGITF